MKVTCVLNAKKFSEHSVGSLKRMDTFLLSIKAAEQKLVDYLSIYKRCKTPQERTDIQQLIFACEERIAKLRAAAKDSPICE